VNCLQHLNFDCQSKIIQWLPIKDQSALAKTCRAFLLTVSKQPMWYSLCKEAEIPLTKEAIPRSVFKDHFIEGYLNAQIVWAKLFIEERWVKKDPATALTFFERPFNYHPPKIERFLSKPSEKTIELKSQQHTAACYWLKTFFFDEISVEHRRFKKVMDTLQELFKEDEFYSAILSSIFCDSGKGPRKVLFSASISSLKKVAQTKKFSPHQRAAATLYWAKASERHIDPDLDRDLKTYADDITLPESVRSSCQNFLDHRKILNKPHTKMGSLD
jgi:hypothetical protein